MFSGQNNRKWKTFTWNSIAHPFFSRLLLLLFWSYFRQIFFSCGFELRFNSGYLNPVKEKKTHKQQKNFSITTIMPIDQSDEVEEKKKLKNKLSVIVGSIILTDRRAKMMYSFHNELNWLLIIKLFTETMTFEILMIQCIFSLSRPLDNVNKE